MKEKILSILRGIFKVHSPTLHLQGKCWCQTNKRNCMTCKHVDLGLIEGPCKDCNWANNLRNYEALDN